ncbi:hypothetical protein [Streptomyces sp. NPDC005303]|uniref:hypothetical protein n=1 Tax=Streptomyces sp. NPDC005303 TaxID=3155713 RepID=UPI0033A2AF2F
MDLAQWRARLAARPPFPYQAVCVLGLVLAAVVSWGSVLVVVAGRVVPAWVLGGALIVVSLVLMGVHGVRRRRSAPDDGDTAVTAGRYVPRRFGYVLLTVLAVVSVGFGVLGDLGAQYLVLRPSGPGGCTAVVRETAFLMAGSGEVYGVGGSTGVAWGPSGSWFADDGYRPVAEGSYELTWGRGEGVLVVHGSSGNPVYPAIHSVDCD